MLVLRYEDDTKQDELNLGFVTSDSDDVIKTVSIDMYLSTVKHTEPLELNMSCDRNQCQNISVSPSTTDQTLYLFVNWCTDCHKEAQRAWETLLRRNQDYIVLYNI